MTDDRIRSGQVDSERIDEGRPYALRDWARRFDVTEEELRDALQSVGPVVEDVRRYLRRH